VKGAALQPFMIYCAFPSEL